MMATNSIPNTPLDLTVLGLNSGTPMVSIEYRYPQPVIAELLILS